MYAFLRRLLDFCGGDQVMFNKFLCDKFGVEIEAEAREDPEKKQLVRFVKYREDDANPNTNGRYIRYRVYSEFHKIMCVTGWIKSVQDEWLVNCSECPAVFVRFSDATAPYEYKRLMFLVEEFLRDKMGIALTVQNMSQFMSECDIAVSKRVAESFHVRWSNYIAEHFSCLSTTRYDMVVALSLLNTQKQTFVEIEV